jgi:hypothetical protein
MSDPLNVAEDRFLARPHLFGHDANPKAAIQGCECSRRIPFLHWAARLPHKREKLLAALPKSGAVVLTIFGNNDAVTEIIASNRYDCHFVDCS